MRSNMTKVLAVGLVSAFCGMSSSAPAAETVLKAITYAPLSKVEDSMVIFRKWVDRVNTAGKGEIRIELLGGPEVFPVSDQMNALSKGLVDAVMTFSVHTPIVPEVDTSGTVRYHADRRAEQRLSGAARQGPREDQRKGHRPDRDALRLLHLLQAADPEA